MNPPRPPVSEAQFRQQLATGHDLVRKREVGKAFALAKQLAGTHPLRAEVWALATDAAFYLGKIDTALRLSDRALSLRAGEPALKLQRARILAASRRRKDFRALVPQLRAEAEGKETLLRDMGWLCFRSQMVPEALDFLAAATQPGPATPHTLYKLAIVRFASGQFAAAEQDIERLLETEPAHGPALYLRSTLRRQTAQANHVEDIRRRLDTGLKLEWHKGLVLYALAKELEDLGDHAGSFDALARGAAIMRASLDYDVQADVTGMAEIAAAFATPSTGQPAPGSQAEPDVIFIVGMPRSGTTLVERLLVQSGKVVSGGEPKDLDAILRQAGQQQRASMPGATLAEAIASADLAALGQEYLRGLREMVPGDHVIIDKLPRNFLHCGAILRALPRARIIHLVRDPLDSCYAMYKTAFFNAYEFSYTQEELAEYFIAYRKLMAHWHQAMPGRILDVRYEDLVADTANQARRLYAWCGLPWTEQALETPGEDKAFATASAAQVREPVHRRSVGSALRHREGLAVLAARLAAAPELGWSLPAMAD